MWKRHGIYITGTLISVLLWALASCSHGTVEDTDVPSAGEMTLSIGFRIPEKADTDGYEEGETYENYIDVVGGNYRIYFFDTDNKFIARFEPHGFVATSGTNYCQYSVLGKAPDALVEHSEVKMVVLANWPRYDDASITENTTIEDICTAEWAQFNCIKDSLLDPGEKRLMPFFGVHEYKGLVFTPGQITNLDEPVTLLRAMAKVEVILEAAEDVADVLLFDTVEINRYNKTGYCAPKDVYSQKDYDHQGSWNEDYVRNVHLLGDANDADDKNFGLLRVRQWSEDGKQYEKWIAYVPEYRNVGAGEAYSSLKARFKLQQADDTPHTIYFVQYDNNGKTDNSDAAGHRLNIERNNIYRFHVKCTSYDYSLQLTVSDWEALYENEFEYGDGQFTTPPAPWDDEIDNEVEF